MQCIRHTPIQLGRVAEAVYHTGHRLRGFEGVSSPRCASQILLGLHGDTVYPLPDFDQSDLGWPKKMEERYVNA